MPKYNALSGGGIRRVDYILFWKCTSCGEKAAFLDAHCSNCNNPLDEQEISKISDTDFQETTDPEVIFKTQEMMGWFCSHCASYSRNLKKADYDSGEYLSDTFKCNCTDCGNEFDGTEQDGDYIMRNGPSASSKIGAVRAMVQLNIDTKKRIYARRTGRSISNNIPPLKSKKISNIGKSHRSQVITILGKKYPKLYFGLGGGVTLLAAFLAYKGFENYETTITVQSQEWMRSLHIESVQNVSKSGWLENVDGSEHQTERFHNYEQSSTFFASTGREDYNHNPNYCRLIPDSEPEIQGHSCRAVTTESCTASSGGGVSCTTSTSSVCDVPIWGTRYFSSEECQKVRYTINDWEFDRNISSPAYGDQSLEPYWPDFIPQGDNFSLGSQREVESRREQTYTVHVTYDNGEKSDNLELPQELWETLYNGLQCPAEADFINGVDLQTIDWDSCGNIMKLGVNIPLFELFRKIID